MSAKLNLADLAQQLAGGDERFKLISQLLESQRSNGDGHEGEEDEQRKKEQQALRFLRRLNTDLAVAAGACVCWGKRSFCSTCHGRGHAGWRAPDERLFFEYFGPLLARLGLMREPGTVVESPRQS